MVFCEPHTPSSVEDKQYLQIEYKKYKSASGNEFMWHFGIREVAGTTVVTTVV